MINQLGLLLDLCIPDDDDDKKEKWVICVHHQKTAMELVCSKEDNFTGEQIGIRIAFLSSQGMASHSSEEMN